MCPEYYRATTAKKYGPPMDICKVNNEPLSQEQINRMCQNNCTSCSLYRSKHSSTRPVSQGQQKSGGSSGGLGIVLIIVVIVAVTKLIGLW